MAKVFMAAWVCALLAAGCGDSDTTGGAGSGGDPSGGGDADCRRICESQCLDDVLPSGTVDDCIRSCGMGGPVFGDCKAETIDFLTCAEGTGCDGSVNCLDESAAFTRCLEF